MIEYNAQILLKGLTISPQVTLLACNITRYMKASSEATENAGVENAGV